MDRSWINASRINDVYEKGVEDFLEFTKWNGASINERYYCLCVNRVNGKKTNIELIREHDLCDGFLKNYRTWTWHGRVLDLPYVSKQDKCEHSNLYYEDCMEGMICDIGEESFHQAHVFDSLKDDSLTELYPNCSSFSRLSAVLRLFSMKARNGWTDRSFTQLLEFLHKILPQGNNTLPTSHYEAKKILCPMGLEYRKIYACPNDCILYRKEFERLHKYSRCGVSRYKVKDDDGDEDDMKKGPPTKVLWYLPIIPCLKHFFANVNDAKNLTWHSNGRKYDGLLRHAADSPQWKKIDILYPEFGSDPRNLRLGLATDGMNLYGNLSSKHSSWPVLLIIICRIGGA